MSWERATRPFAVLLSTIIWILGSLFLLAFALTLGVVLYAYMSLLNKEEDYESILDAFIGGVIFGPSGSLENWLDVISDENEDEYVMPELLYIIFSTVYWLLTLIFVSAIL